MKAIPLVAAAALLALTGCSSEDSAPTTGTSPSSLPPTASSTPTPTAISTPAPTATPAVPACGVEELKPAIGRAGGAAGSLYLTVTLTNASDHACSSGGYGGISFGYDGQQVGVPSERDPSVTKTFFELRPGQSMATTLRVVNYGNYDHEDCKPIKVGGYRIIPPGETQFVFLSDPQTACSAIGILSHTPFQKAAPAPATAACAAADLRVSLEYIGGGAGHRSFELALTNDTGKACTLLSKPATLHFLQGDDAVGQPSQPEGSGRGPILLGAGETARADVDITSAGPYDEAVCKPVPADGIRVDVAGGELQVDHDEQACSGDVTQIRVQPFAKA